MPQIIFLKIQEESGIGMNIKLEPTLCAVTTIQSAHVALSESVTLTRTEQVKSDSVSNNYCARSPWTGSWNRQRPSIKTLAGLNKVWRLADGKILC